MTRRWKSGFSLAVGLVFLLTALLPLPAGAAAATYKSPLKQNPVKVIVNGKQLSLSTPAVLTQNTVLISASDILKALGTSFIAKQKIIAKKGTTSIEMVIGSQNAKLNGKPVKLPIAPRMSNGRAMVPLSFVCQSFGAKLVWNPTKMTAEITTKAAASTVPATAPANVSSAVSPAVSGPAANIQLKRIGDISYNVHDNYIKLVNVQKLAPAEASRQQVGFLQSQPEVALARQVEDGNIFVKYKDGYELLMLLDEDSRGTLSLTPRTSTIIKTPIVTTDLSKIPTPIIDSKLDQAVSDEDAEPTTEETDQAEPSDSEPTYEFADVDEMLDELETKVRELDTADLQHFNIALDTILNSVKEYPSSSKALVFDTVFGDPSEIADMNETIKQKLESLGYQVTTKYNSEANLETIANIDNAGYGVVFISSHGTCVDGDNKFLVGPGYTSPPPSSSGYTGTSVCSVYNGVTQQVEYVYVIGKTFAETYWTRSLPGTLFFMDTCHGMNPGGVQGFPTTVTQKGGSAYLGFPQSVSFTQGDTVSKLFFRYLADSWDTVASVKHRINDSINPPKLYMCSRNANFTLPVWRNDRNESSIPDGKDFKNIEVVHYGDDFIANVAFWGRPTFSEFIMVVDCNNDGAAETRFECSPTEFTAYDVSDAASPSAICTGSAYVSGNTYYLAVDYDTVLPSDNGKLRVNLSESSAGDSMPDAVY